MMLRVTSWAILYVRICSGAVFSLPRAHPLPTLDRWPRSLCYHCPHYFPAYLLCRVPVPLAADCFDQQQAPAALRFLVCLNADRCLSAGIPHQD